MSIFCVGQSAYDITIPLEEPLVENRKYRITRRHECGGGPAFNAACLCAMWGGFVHLISRIGEDPYGEALKEILRSVNVRMDYLIPDREMETPYSMIIAGKESGSRTLFNFPGCRGEVEYPVPAECPKVILTDGHEDKISLELMRAFPDAVSVIDAGTFRDSTYAVAREVDYLVCSEDFARQYTGRQIDLSDWSACGEIFRKVEMINQKHSDHSGRPGAFVSGGRRNIVSSSGISGSGSGFHRSGRYFSWCICLRPVPGIFFAGKSETVFGGVCTFCTEAGKSDLHSFQGRD